MSLRDDLLRLAGELARAAGRSDVTLDDVLEAAIHTSSSPQLRSITRMFEAAAQQFGEPSSWPATQAQLDEVFQRAGALAVALDEPLTAAHVAAIVPRVDDGERHGVARMVQHMLLGMVVGPDPQQMEELRTEIDEQESDDRPTPQVTKRISWHSSERVERDPDVAPRPRCGACHEQLVEPLSVWHLRTDDGEVVAITCGTCDTVLALHPPDA